MLFKSIGTPVDMVEGGVASANRRCALSGGWTVENRRRAERQPALWIGSCHVDGESSDLWRDCAIFDVSRLGVGIDLRHPAASELPSRRVTLLLGVGPSVDMTVTGEVRNAKSGPDDIVQAGIEFVGLTEFERSMIDLLERRAVSRSKG